MLAHSLQFLDSTHKWNHTIFAFLCLTYSTWQNIPYIHPYCHKWQDFILFNGYVIYYILYYICMYVCVCVCILCMCVHMLSHLYYVWLHNPKDCILSGFSGQGILQAWILEWVVMHSSRGSSPHRDRTCITCGPGIAGRLLTTEPPGKPICVYDIIFTH